MTINHAQTAETYGEFTQRESRTVAEYERATAALFDSLDIADDAEVYADDASEYGTASALTLCRTSRRYLAELAEQVDVLRDQLHLTNDGLHTEPSKAAALFLGVQVEALETKKAGVERALLDHLLGSVEQA
ncbi:hypothetical protein [Dactylosporangium sp. NPDC051484]|uniref:hypothetical protein n=1 Tax=Dactylosporangium sp. NPDC051484 TaxID=3154942 RepID=UPI00344EAE0D